MYGYKHYAPIIVTPHPPVRAEVEEGGDLHSWFYKCPRVGAIKSLQIPYYAPTYDQGPYSFTCACFIHPYNCINTDLSNARPLGQVSSDKSPPNPRTGGWGVTMIGALQTQQSECVQISYSSTLPTYIHQYTCSLSSHQTLTLFSWNKTEPLCALSVVPLIKLMIIALFSKHHTT